MNESQSFFCASRYALVAFLPVAKVNGCPWSGHILVLRDVTERFVPFSFSQHIPQRHTGEMEVQVRSFLTFKLVDLRVV